MPFVKKIVVISLTIFLLAPQTLLAAATFNPNNIISDSDLTDKNAMTSEQIQRFFVNNRSTLADYKTSDPWGNTKTAAQIINDAAKYYTISPKFLLVTVQKEQSLVTDTTPNQYQLDWATGYGVCDSCSTSDPAIQQYRGFFNQINWAARRNRYYIETAGQWNFKVGLTYTIDGESVYMSNQATVNLYTYTPHIHGNYLFWSIWSRWFAKNYPDGSLLQVEGEAGVVLIQNGKKRPFYSRAALVSRYDPSRIIQVSKTEMEAYESGDPIIFANYSLVHSEVSGKTYMIDGDEKRLIESQDVFRNIGFNPEEVINVTEKDLAMYADGAPITNQSIYPTGVLLQAKENGAISYVKDGVRHSIASKEILQSRFPQRKPVIVEETTIQQYPQGDKVLFKDGDLVSPVGKTNIYLVSNGQLRGVTSPTVFEGLGLQWKNVIKTSDYIISLHPMGAPIYLNF